MILALLKPKNLVPDNKLLNLPILIIFIFLFIALNITNSKNRFIWGMIRSDDIKNFSWPYTTNIIYKSGTWQTKPKALRVFWGHFKAGLLNYKYNFNSSSDMPLTIKK